MLFNKTLKQYDESKNYKQLGNDAHQIAKWIPKNKEENINQAISMVKLAIEARKKTAPLEIDNLKKSYFNLAIYLKKKNDYDQAISVYKKILKYRDTELLIGKTLQSIGNCYKLLDKHYLAIDYFRKALYYFKSPNDQIKRIKNHLYIAKSYLRLRDKKYASLALFYLNKSESELKSITLKNKGKILYKILNEKGGVFLERIKDTSRAQKYLKKSLRIARELNIKEYISASAYNLGLSYISNYNKAKYYFKVSNQNHENKIYMKRLIHLGQGELERRFGNHKKASNHLLKSLEYFFNTKLNSDFIVSDLTTKFQSIKKQRGQLLEVIRVAIFNYVSQGKKEKNLKAYQNGIKLTKLADHIIDQILENEITDQDKLLLRGIASGIYIGGIQACFGSQNLEYAFYLSEKNKALLLLQDITKENSLIPQKWINLEKQLLQNIYELEDEYYNYRSSQKDSIFQLVFNRKEKLFTLKDSIKNMFPKEQHYNSIPKIIDLENLSLNENEIMIQYFMVERIVGVYKDTYCLVINKDQKLFLNLENTKTLLPKIEEFRRLLQTPFTTKEDILKFHKLSHELYQTLIPQKIQPLLIDKKVTIIPDHLLNLLPFDALITDPNKGTYLMEESEISYTYSLSFQKQNENRLRITKQDFLGVAPVHFKSELFSLKKSKEEIEDAENRYSGKLLLEENSTKDNFIQNLEDYKILHLATHAEAFALDSISPWIAFHDKKIISKEIGLLRNNAELVFLSACNTSFGHVNSGEGVLSLTREFFKSGAKSVISSLWSTNDKATATITGDFYKHLSKGKTKSEALRLAKLNYLKNNSDAEASPHYWASLILIGDTGVLLPETNYLWWYIAGGILLLIIITTLLIFKRKRTKA